MANRTNADKHRELALSREYIKYQKRVTTNRETEMLGFAEWSETYGLPGEPLEQLRSQRARSLLERTQQPRRAGFAFIEQLYREVRADGAISDDVDVEQYAGQLVQEMQSNSDLRAQLHERMQATIGAELADGAEARRIVQQQHEVARESAIRVFSAAGGSVLPTARTREAMERGIAEAAYTDGNSTQRSGSAAA